MKRENEKIFKDNRFFFFFRKLLLFFLCSHIHAIFHIYINQEHSNDKMIDLVISLLD